MTHARIELVEGGYLLHLEDWPFQRGGRQVVCKTLEDAIERARRFLAEREGRTDVKCEACQGIGRQGDDADGYGGYACGTCAGLGHHKAEARR